jgi:hypothetical protein
VTKNDLRKFRSNLRKGSAGSCNEGNPGERPATCGLCQRGVAHGAYTHSDSQGAFPANRRAWRA